MFIIKVLQENSLESVYNYWVSIQDKLRQFKGLVQSTDFILTVLILVVSVVSFALGRVSMNTTEDIVHTSVNNSASVMGSSPIPLPGVLPTSTVKISSPVISYDSEKMYVASKTGTKYHLPWCGSAKQIKEENKIWFASKEDAEKAGYTPASNCKGI